MRDLIGVWQVLINEAYPFDGIDANECAEGLTDDEILEEIAGLVAMLAADAIR